MDLAAWRQEGRLNPVIFVVAAVSARFVAAASSEPGCAGFVQMPSPCEVCETLAVAASVMAMLSVKAASQSCCRFVRRCRAGLLVTAGLREVRESSGNTRHPAQG